MERVAFIIERSNERIGALLNPESLVMRRVAGVRARGSAGGQLAGAGRADDALLFTGGGRTELELDLLFDVSLAGSSIASGDVRDLTAPLWNLAENAADENGYRQPPLVRFVWGKSWNVPGVISAIAERLEEFSSTGVPRRSWLRMRLVRVAEAAVPAAEALQLPAELNVLRELSREDVAAVAENLERSGDVRGYEISGAAGEQQGIGERLEEIAFRFYGNPALWRLLAVFNDLADPLRLQAGSLLRVPPLNPAVAPRVAPPTAPGPPGATPAREATE